MARIILVDDESGVRSFIEEVLIRYGHDVQTIPGGLEALARLKKCPPDIVITDILMPNMSGIKLIEEIRKIRPDQKIIAISGGGPNFNAETCVELARTSGADEALMKPFSMNDLKATVERILGTDSRPQPRDNS